MIYLEYILNVLIFIYTTPYQINTTVHLQHDYNISAIQVPQQENYTIYLQYI